MCMSVSGALRNRSFKGMTDGAGRPLTPKQAESALRRLQAEGIKVLPLSKECEGFSYQTGCPGHETTSAVESR